MAPRKITVKTIAFQQHVYGRSKLASYLSNQNYGPFELEYHGPEAGPEGFLFKRDRTDDHGNYVPLVEFFPMCSVAHLEFVGYDGGGLLDRTDTMDEKEIAADCSDVDAAVNAIEELVKEANHEDFKVNGHPKPQSLARKLKRRGITTEFTERAYAEYLKRGK